MNIKTTNIFKKSFKKLLKKDKHLISQYENLIKDLNNTPTLGTKIGENKYKIRLANISNNKGKSSGYRIITYTKIENTIILVHIYSKTNIDNLSEHKIDEIIEEYNK